MFFITIGSYPIYPVEIKILNKDKRITSRLLKYYTKQPDRHTKSELESRLKRL
ncbi:hypothetical protein KL86DYS2_13001 [uncultured Dysgonomonas sp.]|uniref:Uncharacterized protein n=1 Tax=uncultured Dysgonomonas sp. TaxID=206096 RepID=A0A212K4L6_9BACT|nr:hypothetical protein KL86DYS2_13001 [uncultured Dysgonomonas sp.]